MQPGAMSLTQPQKLPLVALLLASAVSQIGDAMAMVALPWFVLHTTGSPTLTGLAGAATVLPSFAAGILGGVLVDRIGYRLTAIIANVVSGLAIAGIPLLYQAGNLRITTLLGLIFLGSLLAVPQLTACRSMLPELATRASMRLERVNAAFESMQHLSFLLGPPLAGVLIALVDAPGVLWVDAATFAVAAFLIAAAIPVLSVRTRKTSTSYGAELLTGLRFLVHDRLLLTIALSLALTNFFGNTLFAVVLPVYTQAFGGQASDLGFMVAAEGAGSLIGISIYGAIGHHLPRRATWIIGYFAFALMLWVMAAVPPISIVAAALLVSGIIGGPLNPLSVTVRQERIPIELRGRVFSTFSAVSMVSAPFGIIAAGGLIERAGLSFTLIALASCYTLVCLSMLFVPTLREMDRRA